MKITSKVAQMYNMCDADHLSRLISVENAVENLIETGLYPTDGMHFLLPDFPTESIEQEIERVEQEVADFLSGDVYVSCMPDLVVASFNLYEITLTTGVSEDNVMTGIKNASALSWVPGRIIPVPPVYHRYKKAWDEGQHLAALAGAVTAMI